MAENNPIESAFDPKVKRSRVNELQDRYPGLKTKDIPERLLALDMDQIQAMEDSMRKEFGFAREEIRFVMRHKPTFLFN